MICKRGEGRHNISLNDLGITEDQIIVLSIAGSNMYGTATEDSDKDYLGVYVPTKQDILLSKIKHQIHLPKESGLDLQMWSIHYFLKLLLQGETMAMDLLHSPYHCWVYYNHDIWTIFQESKSMFYTKNMKAFVSYARKQAAKYGVKGERISTLQQVISFLKSCCKIDENQKLKNLWNYLPQPKHVHFIDGDPVRMYQVCGTKFQETVTVKYALDHLEKMLTDYGKRAMKAADNEGIDWKAISHAIRAANQVYDILKYGGYSYPLTNAKFIKMVKVGQISYEMAEAVLEDFLDEIERLMEESTLPETSVVASYHWENAICDYMERIVCNG